MNKAMVERIWNRWRISGDQVRVKIEDTGETFYWLHGVIFQQVKPTISVRTSKQQINTIRKKIEEGLFTIVRMIDDESHEIIFRP